MRTGVDVFPLGDCWDQPEGVGCAGEPAVPVFGEGGFPG